LPVTARPRALTHADIPQAMRIKEAAGWNQTERDWHSLLRLAPETCFGLDCDGALAATATAVCYARRLAWIGMVLTSPAQRRRGFARLLLEHTIETLIARQIEWIKLDATEMGVPLYRQLGFEPESAVERWAATAAQPPGSPLVDPWGNYPALDRHAFGADRSDLLALLAPMGAAAIADQGYAVARSGSQAAYFGPCVSCGPETAGKPGLVFGETRGRSALLGSAAAQPGNRKSGALPRISAVPQVGPYGSARRCRRGAARP
jgi:GNAT superfamily N-acetyltransferase